MYNMNTALPAPYELNAPAQMAYSAAPPMMAHGGRAKHRKMVLVHANPKELDIMDHLQGDMERCPRTGLRSYGHLEELFKNPHIVANVHHHARRNHHAMGGHQPIHHMHSHHPHHAMAAHQNMHHLAEEGRHGDTEMALIGHHTRHLFDQLAGHPTRNPHTGHPEYFNLKDALSGAWNAIKGVGSTIAPYAGTALGGLFGGPAGAAAGMAAGQGLSKLLGGGENASPAMQTLGQGAQRAYDAYKGGLSPQQALAHGTQYIGGRMGGGVGKALQGFGSAYSQGQGLGSSLGQGARTGFEQMGGTGGLMNAAKNIAGSYGSQGGLGGGITNALQDYRSKFMPQFEQQQIPQLPANQQIPAGITADEWASL